MSTRPLYVVGKHGTTSIVLFDSFLGINLNNINKIKGWKYLLRSLNPTAELDQQQLDV